MSRRCCVQLNKLTTPCECDFLSYQPQSTSCCFARSFVASHPRTVLPSSFSPSFFFFIRLPSLSLSLLSSAQPAIVSSPFVTVLLTLPLVLYVILAACPSPSFAPSSATNGHTDRLQLSVVLRSLFRVKKSTKCIPSRLPCYGTLLLSAQLC